MYIIRWESSPEVCRELCETSREAGNLVIVDYLINHFLNGTILNPHHYEDSRDLLQLISHGKTFRISYPLKWDPITKTCLSVYHQTVS